MEDTAMQTLTDCPGHWLECAENAEHLAKEMDDLAAKRDMRDVAEAYRRIARRSAEREATRWTPEIAFRLLGGM
jgi:hypothetical protein